MSNANDPAYPVQIVEDRDGIYQPAVNFCEVGGLTKREAFAMAAMQGLLASPFDQTFQPATTVPYAVFATDCVNYADALLAELAKENAK